MRLVSIDCDTLAVRRYDTELLHVEPTHAGRLLGSAGIHERIEYFRLCPPPVCAVAEREDSSCAA